MRVEVTMTSWIFLAVVTTVCLVMKPVPATTFTVNSQTTESPTARDPCPHKPPKLENGVSTLDESRVNAFYRCNPGYTLYEPNGTSLRCQDGQWVGSVPVCSAPGCQEIPRVEPAIIIRQNRGTVLGYKCYPGYERQGSAFIYCDGTRWRNELPRCVFQGSPSSCPEPLIINNARMMITAGGVGVSYICAAGYQQRLGSRTIICGTDSQWIGYPAVCTRAGCPVPGANDVSNGVIAIKQSMVLKITCHPGYDLVGSSALFCDGQRWNGSLPTCQPHQPQPHNVGYPTMVEDGTRCPRSSLVVPNSVPQYDTQYDAEGRPFYVVRYNCNRGYTLQPANYAVYCTGGNVLGTPPHCYAHCGHDNGGCLHVCRNTDQGAVCSCRDGYKLDNDGKRCTVACESYLPPGNGYQVSCNTKDMRTGTLCSLTCSEGYEPEGHLQIGIWCHLNEAKQVGEWSTTGGGRCNAKTCPILVAKMHMRIIPPDCMERQLDYKSQCFYVCENGFQLRGVSSRTCQADGTWSDPSVQNTCIDVEPPEFTTCPGDISLPTDLHQNYTTNPANWDQPEARDNDGEPVIEASSSTTQQRFYLDEVTVITYTARDEAGLESTCTFSITVKDDEPPQVINCPDSIAVKTNNRLAVVHWEEPVFQDNSGHDVSVIFNRPSGSTFFFGKAESIWYITEDQAGNTARCEFTVSEEDLDPPEFFTCPEDMVLPTNLHENFTTTTWNKPEARDNLGTPTIEASLSAAKERFYLDEVTVVTYTARDRTGLESTCTFNITVRDEEPPQVVRCPDSIAVETRGSSEIVHWAEPVFQDNSGKEVTVISDFPSGFNFFCGLQETVQYIAEDPAGNTVICEFTVDVICMK